jgi:rhamnose utilization protein RhaD (predicted bifunctional aldolase and dehydrogenase)
VHATGVVVLCHEAHESRTGTTIPDKTIMIKRGVLVLKHDAKITSAARNELVETYIS